MLLGLRRALTYGYCRRVYYCTIWVSDLQLGTFLKNYLHCIPKYSYRCRRLLWNTCGYQSLIFSQWFPTKFRNGPNMWGRRSGRPMFAHGLIENMEWSGFPIIPSRFKPLSSCPARSRSTRVHGAPTKLQIPCWPSCRAGCKKNGVSGVFGGCNMSENMLTQHI